MNKDTQSWSNSNLTEMEELLLKVQQLERDNAELRADAERYRYIKNSETMEVSEILQAFVVSITFDLDAAIDAARKEGQL